MPSVKIPKKSTFVDMTPFVDVAFLILTFFIMATKFKPEEPVEIKTPNSVSTKDLPDTDAVQVTFDSTGRVFFSVLAAKDPTIKYKQLLAVPVEDQKNFKQPGIPLDTLGGELYYWIRDAVGTFSGKKLQFLIKGDNNAKYPAFKQVLSAFKKNEIFKFQMITMLEDAPAGSELAIMRNREKNAGK